MASLKRIGFFWGEEKITLVEFEKNAPIQVVSSALGAKAAASPFSSNLTEEIQGTVILKKLLQDNHITGKNFYISLPLKEIILRSFVIPYVKNDDIPNAIKFEAKKYIPFEIQDLAYSYYTIPFEENKAKRLQVVFFAARKEVLTRYDRILSQIDSSASCAEPYIVSLSKALLFRKEISANDHIAFLILDKTLGRICFIDKGVPQFIREFPLTLPPDFGESAESPEAMNSKIVNEVLNSFDFYARQFNSEKIGRVLVSSDFVQKDLMATLEAELKLKIVKFSATINTSFGSSGDMDAIYAMGACVNAPIDALSTFNFLTDKEAQSSGASELLEGVKTYIESIVTFVVCAIFLVTAFVMLQMRLKLSEHKYAQLSVQQGTHTGEQEETIQAKIDQDNDLLTKYKKIRMKSDVADIILRVASHLPKDSVLTSLRINFAQSDAVDSSVSIDLQGVVFSAGQFSDQVATVNQIFADFKNDPELAAVFKDMSLQSLNPTTYKDRQAAGFLIHCS